MSETSKMNDVAVRGVAISIIIIALVLIGLLAPRELSIEVNFDGPVTVVNTEPVPGSSMFLAYGDECMADRHLHGNREARKVSEEGDQVTLLLTDYPSRYPDHDLPDCPPGVEFRISREVYSSMYHWQHEGGREEDRRIRRAEAARRGAERRVKETQEED